MQRAIVVCSIIWCAAASGFAQTDDVTMQIFKIQHGNAQSLYQLVDNMKSEAGRVSFDANTGSIIVIDYPANIARIASTIDMLDVAEKQVNIQVEIIEADRAALHSMGITSSRVIIPQVQFLTLANFINTSNAVTVHTRMSVMTLSNQPALIQVNTDAVIGDEVVELENGGQVVQPLRKKIGKALEVLPRVNNDGTVTLMLRPSVSTLEENRMPSEAQITTRVTLKDGDTVALGALETTKEGQTQSDSLGIFLLGKAASENKRVVMFLTADIAH